MYEKILVPLDGSPRAEEILPHVVDLASKYGSSIMLLQVVEVKMVGNGVEFMPLSEGWELIRKGMEEERRKAETYLNGTRFRLQAKGLEVQTRTACGPVVEAIISTAIKEDIHLIAMASHGRTGAARVFYGSVASGVLHRVDRPLLLVRSASRE
jgi:nucleotide-binding universal stress UspA family protein